MLLIARKYFPKDRRGAVFLASTSMKILLEKKVNENKVNSARVLENVSRVADSLRRKAHRCSSQANRTRVARIKNRSLILFTNSQDDKKKYLLICSSPFLPPFPPRGRLLLSYLIFPLVPLFSRSSFFLFLSLSLRSRFSPPPSPSSSPLLSFHNLLPPFSISFRTVSTSDPSERRREKPELITI